MAIPVVKAQEARLAKASIRTTPLAGLVLALVVVVAMLWPTAALAEDAGWAMQSSNTDNTLYGVWGSSSSDVLVCGAGGTIRRYDGEIWTPMDSGTTRGLYDVWGYSSDNVFAVGGYGTILRYEGSSWNSMTSGTTEELYGVWGASDSDVFAVGNNGTILHYDGSAWSLMVSGVPNHLFSVWGGSFDSVFAVGSRVLLHYDGVGWTTMPWPAEVGLVDLWGVWGGAANDVFAVGNSGTILRYNGSIWSLMTSGTTNDLRGVWGTSSSDVFAVGAGGTILHYDGIGWSPMGSGSSANLRGIWGAAPLDVYAVGDNGIILHYDANAPIITSVAPSVGYQGEALSAVIEGQNLNEATGLNFGPGITASITVNSATQITASITISGSATPGARDVSVTTPVGTVTKIGAFAVNPAGPTISAVSPGSGTQGQSLSVIITGTYLTGASSVGFGTGITVTGHTVNSATQITASISISGSATPGARDVMVTTLGGTGMLEGGFGVVAMSPLAPLVSGVAPAVGTCGDDLEVVISGSNLGGASEVSFGEGIVVSYVVDSSTQITVSISIAGDAVTGTRDVMVTTPDGSDVLYGGFEVVAALPQLPEIIEVSPGTGVCGEVLEVVISGSNLGGASEVSFGDGIEVRYIYVGSSETQITASIAVSGSAAAGARDVMVTTLDGTDTLESGFEVVAVLPTPPGLPEVTSVSPRAGTCGDDLEVVISGSNLGGASEVSFGAGIVVSYVVDSEMQITANIRIADDVVTGTRDVVVITPAGSDVLYGGFEVVAESQQAFSPFTPWFWTGIILFGALGAFFLIATREKKPEPKRWSLLPPSYRG